MRPLGVSKRQYSSSGRFARWRPIERHQRSPYINKGLRQGSLVERAHGTFYRRFALPEEANLDRINARCNQGVLQVEIPKRESVQPPRIEVG
jgi:HSP20 family protein